MIKPLAKLLAFALCAATCTGDMLLEGTGGEDDFDGLVVWYSTDAATISSQTYAQFNNRRGTNFVGDATPWDSNPATNLTSTLSGYAIARFDGVNDRYSANITGAFTGAVHVLMVARAPTWTGGYNNFVNINEDKLRIQEDAAVPGRINIIRKHGGAGSDLGFDHTVSGMNTNIWFIGSWAINGAASRSWIRFNGTNSFATGNCGTNVLSSTVRFPWFSGLNLDIEEIRIYNKPKSETKATNLVNRMRSKYRLP